MELPTLSDLSQRLEHLNPEAKPVWGKMNLAQMLLHCRMAMEAGLGERELQMKGNFVTRWILFPIMMRLPWPKGKALAIWRQGKFGPWEHSLFGKISKPGWDLLQRRHLDHHFRQFGI
jgi:hypothetical protein